MKHVQAYEYIITPKKRRRKRYITCWPTCTNQTYL